jgi:uncharacterized membrane protein YeaQ/YmgE (transglycosylase-associated protein family)
MSIIGWLILGLIAGFIASKLYSGTGQGVVLDIVLGVVGAFVGGFIFDALGGVGVTGFNLWSMVVAIIGAVIVLWIYHAVSGRRAM